MKIDQPTISVYYDADSATHRRLVAQMQPLVCGLRSFPLRRGSGTATLWRTFADLLDTDLAAALNPCHPYYQRYLKGRNLNREDLLTVLSTHPDLLRAPIGVSGGRAMVCNVATDVCELLQVLTKEG